MAGKWKGFLIELKNKISQDQLPLASAAISFYLMLSLIPLLLLLISVASFFISISEAQQLVERLTASLGAGVGGAVRTQVLTVVDNRGLLTGIALLIGLWSGSQVFVYIQTALDLIWGVAERRSFIVKRGLALLMVVISGILVVIAIAAGYLVHLIGRVTLPFGDGHISDIPWLITAAISFILPAFLILLVFAIIYRYLPAYRANWRPVFFGALIACILWVLVLQVFSWYTANFANYNVLYGSLGGLILLMLWFNYSSLIMLIGAEIAAISQRRHEENQPAPTA